MERHLFTPGLKVVFIYCIIVIPIDVQFDILRAAGNFNFKELKVSFDAFIARSCSDAFNARDCPL